MAELFLMWLGEKQHLSIKLALLLLLSSGHTTFYRGESQLGRKDHCLGSRPKERKGSTSFPLSRVSQLTNQPLSFDGSPRQQVRILTQRSSS